MGSVIFVLRFTLVVLGVAIVGSAGANVTEMLGAPWWGQLIVGLSGQIGIVFSVLLYWDVRVRG